MNHLDVGYYDGLDQDVGFAVQVLNRYQTEYFVRAINMSRSLINLGYVERFIYTTHPWLVSLYLNCPNITFLSTPLKCPNRTEQADFIKAVFEGHIAWHAFPMNIQTDFLGARLFDRGVDISQRLDKEFGIVRTHATMSQRDVPGMTKALLPLLMARGVKAISVGVNPGTAPPAVPSPFVWKLRNSDPDGIMAFWVKGGYPLNPGPNPANPIGLAKDKCISANGLSEVLCFAFRTDNTGPPVTVTEILGYYEILRAEYPGAELVASTFDNFVKALETVKSSLPVRSFEIGDTWIQGITSDPKKCAMYRAFTRAWENCDDMGLCSESDPRIPDMLRFLIKLPEHTWGAHNFLDNVNWTNQELANARQTVTYQSVENTWKEQRQFLDFALNALGDHPLSEMVQAEYKDLIATIPDLSGYTQTSVGVDYVCPGGVIVQFNINGSLTRLYDPHNKREWASESSPLGRLTYDTYIEQDFIDMAKLYNYEAGVGYDKPNVSLYAHPEKRSWEISVLNLYRKVNSSSCDFWVEATTNDNQTRTKYGAPQVFYVRYVADSSVEVNITLLMLGKVTTRLPESISFSFAPQNLYDSSWHLSKMKQSINPCDVVLNGSQYVHGVDENGISFLDNGGQGLQIQTTDVPIVFIGTTDHIASPFPVPLHPFNCSSITTMAFNIYNNIWNTNYIYWYPYIEEDADFKARFAIRFV
uniref:Glycoside hydrolase family 38 N-terminal domain-containing protein n=1 Tax=Arion vulgaris TaxID=1028688 RepID=A0A0B7AAX7_9EUPU